MATLIPQILLEVTENCEILVTDDSNWNEEFPREDYVIVLSVEDPDGNTTLNYDNIDPIQPQSVEILNEDFNDPTNTWTTVNNSTGGTPASAEWTLRPDLYDNSSGIFSSNDYTQFYLCDSDAQGPGGTTNTELISPSFSTVGFVSAVLTFYQFFAGGTVLTANVEYSISGGAWVILESQTNDTGQFSNFLIDSVNLPVGESHLRVRFTLNGDYGLWWAIDNVVVTGYTDVYVPGDTTWTISTTMNGQYTLCEYIIPVYDIDSDVPILDGELWYYNGVIYEHHGIPWVPSVSPFLNPFTRPQEWYPVTTVEKYEENTQYLVCDSIMVTCQDEYPITVSSVRTGCHLWRLYTDNSAGSFTVNVYNYNQFETSETMLDQVSGLTPIVTYEWDQSLSTSVDITLPEDGAYLVVVYFNNDDDEQVYSTSLTIIDYCDARSCMTNLALSINCREKDPCCKNCTEAQKKQYQRWQDTLNMLILLTDEVFDTIYPDFTNCLYGTPSTTVGVDIEHLNELNARILSLTEFCGECPDDIEDVTELPCTNCD